MTDQILNFFPTILFKRYLGDMAQNNRQLAALIAQLEASVPNAAAGTSTRGGFQTREDLLSGEHVFAAHPALMALKQHIADAVNAYSTMLIQQECAHIPAQVDTKIWGWGVVLRGSNWQGHHVHPGAHISGVYYVAAPPLTLMDDTDAGKISFFDPRPRANMNQMLTQNTRHTEKPNPGDMLLFPSWLEHSVAPFEGEGARICIAFNVKLTMA